MNPSCHVRTPRRTYRVRADEIADDQITVAFPNLNSVPWESVNYKSANSAIARRDEQAIRPECVDPIQNDSRLCSAARLGRAVDVDRIRDRWERGRWRNSLNPTGCDIECDRIKYPDAVVRLDDRIAQCASAA